MDPRKAVHKKIREKSSNISSIRKIYKNDYSKMNLERGKCREKEKSSGHHVLL